MTYTYKFDLDLGIIPKIVINIHPKYSIWISQHHFHRMKSVEHTKQFLHENWPSVMNHVGLTPEEITKIAQCFMVGRDELIDRGLIREAVE